jgi:hypothetical protein
MKKLLIFGFILFSINIHSQITIHFKDTISKKPSPFIMVFNENKEIIGYSNELGEIHLEKNNKLTDKIFIESIFYEKKELLINKLDNNSIVLLEPKINVLNEIEIDNNKKYLVLTGYYRIYNLIDNDLNTFVDAEVKYIFKNNSIEKKVLNFRIFDTIRPKDYKSYQYFWVSDLEKSSLFETLNSKFHLINNEEKKIINIVGKKDGEIYGTIRTDKNFKTKSNIVIKIFKGFKHFNGISVEEYNNEELLTTTIKDLKYRFENLTRQITDVDIKSNPLLKEKEKIFSKRELFIQSVDYLSKEEYKKLNKLGYKDTTISHYTKEFWKDLETFTPLEPSIEKQLNDILVERK